MPFRSNLTAHVRWPVSEDDEAFVAQADAIRMEVDMEADLKIIERPHMTRDGVVATMIRFEDVPWEQVSRQINKIETRIAPIFGALIAEIRYGWVFVEEGQEVV